MIIWHRMIEAGDRGWTRKQRWAPTDAPSSTAGESTFAYSGMSTTTGRTNRVGQGAITSSLKGQAITTETDQEMTTREEDSRAENTIGAGQETSLGLSGVKKVSGMKIRVASKDRDRPGANQSDHGQRETLLVDFRASHRAACTPKATHKTD